MILDAIDPVDFVVTLSDGPLPVSFGRREYADDDRLGWRAWTPPRTKREALFYSAWKRLCTLPLCDRDAAMANLRANLTAKHPEMSRAMSVDEIRQLVAGGLITLGGHTVDHPDLCRLRPDEALDQIAQGKAETEEIVGTTIDGFAYPYGRTNARVRALVIEAGFQWACTTEPGFVGASRTDQYAMPRIAAVDTTARPFDAYIGRKG
jgi:Polysaccharide deacetylase